MSDVEVEGSGIGGAGLGNLSVFAFFTCSSRTSTSLALV